LNCSYVKELKSYAKYIIKVAYQNRRALRSLGFIISKAAIQCSGEFCCLLMWGLVAFSTANSFVFCFQMSAKMRTIKAK